VGSRRWFLQTGLAGLAGLSLPDLLRYRAEAVVHPHRSTPPVGGRRRGDRKAVILIWLSGGPSHIDTWDPKSDAPAEVRGPFGSICHQSASLIKIVADTALIKIVADTSLIKIMANGLG